MIRFCCRNVSRFKNQTSASCQRRRSAAERVSRSKYSGYCGGSLGKIIVKYGDGIPMLHSANSSSCGRSQPVIMLSIGRRDGSKNRKRVITKALIRK